MTFSLRCYAYNIMPYCFKNQRFYHIKRRCQNLKQTHILKNVLSFCCWFYGVAMLPKSYLIDTRIFILLCYIIKLLVLCKHMLRPLLYPLYSVYNLYMRPKHPLKHPPPLPRTLETLRLFLTLSKKRKEKMLWGSGEGVSW